VNANVQFSGGALQPQIDAFPPGCELDRLRENVADHLLQARCIRFDKIVGRLHFRRQPHARPDASGRALLTAVSTIDERCVGRRST
jgi:hypothetical protein